jgi:hypothetical protein
MKTLWQIIAAVAVLNILAVGGLVGWLKATDRLSPDRVRAVKAMFTPTVGEESAAKAEAEAAEKKKVEEKARSDKMAEPPATAAERIAEGQFRDEQKTQTILRLQQDLETIRGNVARQMADLEAREKRLVAERTAFEAERRAIVERETGEQFKAALATLEGQKPKDAKAMLRAIIEGAGGAAGSAGATTAVGMGAMAVEVGTAGGAPGKGMEQAVAYLAKMDEGKRAKVVAEFVKDDPAMAAVLLERLRTRGVAAAQGGPTGDGAAKDPRQAAAHDPGAGASERNRP